MCHPEPEAKDLAAAIGAAAASLSAILPCHPEPASGASRVEGSTRSDYPKAVLNHSVSDENQAQEMAIEVPLCAQSQFNATLHGSVAVDLR